jgi:crotonobetainyl-CoA:carnitine CoA-transferase CaiB-like acyl-CoA transferase
MAATVQHETRGPIRVLAPTATLSRTPGKLERSLVSVGQDTDDVLGELGSGADDIARMKRDGIL